MYKQYELVLLSAWLTLCFEFSSKAVHLHTNWGQTHKWETNHLPLEHVLTSPRPHCCCKRSQTGFHITHSVPLTTTESHQPGPLLEILLTCYTLLQGCASRNKSAMRFLCYLWLYFQRKNPPCIISDTYWWRTLHFWTLQCLWCLLLILLWITGQMEICIKMTYSAQQLQQLYVTRSPKHLYRVITCHMFCSERCSHPQVASGCSFKTEGL